MKRFLIILSIFILIIIGSYLMFNNREIKEEITEEVKPEKIIKFNTNPDQAIVFIDNKKLGITPFEIKLKIGKYFLKIKKTNYEEYNSIIEIKEETDEINIDLKKEELDLGTELKKQHLVVGPIIFDNYILNTVCCSKGFYAYSGLYLNDKVIISGYAYKTINGFYIVYPSGKKIYVELLDSPYPDEKYFSKEVLFDEIGKYKIISDKEEFISTFEVCYKLALISEYDKIVDLFENIDKNKFILVPFNKEVDLTFRVTDAHGNLIKNKDLGIYNLKSDNNGILNLKVLVKKERDIEPIKIYINNIKGDMKIYDNKFLIAYEYMTYDRNGNLLETNSSLPPTYEKINIIEKNNSIYIPLEIINIGFHNLINYEISSRENNIFIHPKNTEIIYLDSAVSIDGGKTWRKYELVNFFDTIGINTDKPNILYAWTNIYKNFLLKSEDFGENFDKIEIPDLDYIEKIIVLKDTIYLGTWKGLLKSNDFGKNWEFLIKDVLIKTFSINPKNENEILIGTFNKILKTLDGGKTWKKIDIEIFTPYSIVFDQRNSNVIYLGTDSGLFRSINKGDSFELINYLKIIGKEGIIIDNKNNVYVASNGDGIYKIENYGKKLTKIDSRLSDYLFNIAINDKNEIFINYSGVPFKINTNKDLEILDNDIFLKENIKINIINNKIFIDIKSINFENLKVILEDNKFKIINWVDLNQT